jgi:hypothetical protein
MGANWFRVADEADMKPDILEKIMDEQDRDFIRVLEDLIHVLVAQGVITLDMLPAEAVEKLSARKQLRNSAVSTGTRRADPRLIDQKLARMWGHG